MTVTTVTSREFNHDTGRAKVAAQSGPVIITDRGIPAHVLLTYEEYERLTGGPSVVDLLSLVAGADVDDTDLDAPPLRDLARPVDLD